MIGSPTPNLRKDQPTRGPFLPLPHYHLPLPRESRHGCGRAVCPRLKGFLVTSSKQSQNVRHRRGHSVLIRNKRFFIVRPLVVRPRSLLLFYLGHISKFSPIGSINKLGNYIVNAVGVNNILSRNMWWYQSKKMQRNVLVVSGCSFCTANDSETHKFARYNRVLVVTELIGSVV